MTALKKQLLSSFLGATLVLLLLVIISLDDLSKVESPETVMLRELKITRPPPPPPPPVQAEKSAQNAVPQLSETIQQIPIELTSMNLDVKLAIGEFTGTGSSDWGEQVGLSSNTVSLGGLDGVPIVMSAPLTRFPPELEEQGISMIEMHLHIMIDEQGNAYLIKILDNSYPAINDTLEDFVANTQFTPPTLLGVPVRTEFNWPVKIGKP